MSVPAPTSRCRARPFRLEFGPERDDRRLQFGDLRRLPAARTDCIGRIAGLPFLLETTAQGVDRLPQPGNFPRACRMRLADRRLAPPALVFQFGPENPDRRFELRVDRTEVHRTGQVRNGLLLLNTLSTGRHAASSSGSSSNPASARPLCHGIIARWVGLPRT